MFPERIKMDRIVAKSGDSSRIVGSSSRGIRSTVAVTAVEVEDTSYGSWG